MENFEIKLLKYPKLAKCSCCDRVRDIYYKGLIYDVDDNSSVVGDLELCKLCGENIFRSNSENKNSLLGPGERVVKTFNFKK